MNNETQPESDEARPETVHGRSRYPLLGAGLKQKKELSDLIFIEFKQIGNNKINIDYVLSKWEKDTWFISQYRNAYSLLVQTPKGKKLKIKSSIFEDQAKIVINGLGLQYVQSPVFRNARTWTLC